ncbi:glycosyltransferase family 4 protein [Comamonas sp.]|uniref:glycosyltransferase family 4 protein n=1 Tax=Comamonas sp. TaxID=34028 RepID=UPI0026498754|nr:glycosyltransferase family 4 protein [Comamonas sp.]MDN5537304.1 glycosyltransferase family 4 protein [Comamonas sp.]
MNVLYLHPAAAFGGASKSLIELYAFLHQSGVRGTILAPRGPVCQSFADAGMHVRAVRGLSQFDNTRYGYYRKLRWIILLRELFLLPGALLGLWRLRREPFDLVHINEITLLPLGLVARRLLGVPLVVHVRSLQRKPGEGLRTRWLNGLLRRYADAVVCIDHTVAGTLDGDLAPQIIHNGLKVSKQAEVMPRQGSDGVVKVGFLGVLIPLKGIFELVEAMRILKQRGVCIQCLVAGENARQLSGLKAWVLGKLGFARDVRAEVDQIIVREQLAEQIKMLGFVGDVRTLYPELDILCFPSHLDAAGRPVFEAAFYSVPSVVAVQNPVPDAIIHEVTGLAIDKPDPVQIADALQRLAESPEWRRQLGVQARAWAEQNFSISTNAELMLDLYRRIHSRRRGG